MEQTLELGQCNFGGGMLDEVVNRLKNAKAKGGHKPFTCRVAVRFLGMKSQMDSE